MDKVKTVGVIGGGIFGCTIAIELARAGYTVTLFERAGDIMTAASGINQYRMHRGYHYPRSPETIRSSKATTPLFEEEYSDAIIRNNTHYYAIAKEGSKITGEQFLHVLKEEGLPYTVVTPPHINAAVVDVVVEVEEHLYDPALLYELITKRLQELRIEVKRNTEVDVDDLDDYDFVVVATYANLNGSLKGRVDKHHDYQFEVCEKIVVEIPDELKGTSTVVMDGPFMCFDPLGSTGYAVMGHVEHAIHERSFGSAAAIPSDIKPLLNKGIIKNPPVTNFPKFIAESVKFMPALMNARHVGSMFTIRTVLPKVDATDERPTIIESLDHRVFTVYSGKIGNSVEAARDIVAKIKALP